MNGMTECTSQASKCLPGFFAEVKSIDVELTTHALKLQSGQSSQWLLLLGSTF